MEEITNGWGSGFREMAKSQDKIGWRRFMEGMISCKLLPIQSDYVDMGECTLLLGTWAKELVARLLETTHGQWLYRNVHVHDTVTGTKVTERKERLQQFIKDQMELGEEGLDEKDHFLLEINLDDLETTSGEDQQYWLLQIVAARRDYELKCEEQRRSEAARDQRGRRA